MTQILARLAFFIALVSLEGFTWAVVKERKEGRGNKCYGTESNGNENSVH
jgi:hypothetical protein